MFRYPIAAAGQAHKRQQTSDLGAFTAKLPGDALKFMYVTCGPRLFA
jgi:hypothetical protein